MNPETIVAGVFEDGSAAEAARTKLMRAGVPDERLAVVSPETEGDAEGAARRLDESGIAESQLQPYYDVLRDGHGLLLACVPEHTAADLARAFEELGAATTRQHPIEERHAIVPASDVHFEPFQQTVLELPEFTEEVVAVKRPWVIEELVVTPSVRERVVHARETLRRHDVSVEHEPR